MKKKTIARVLLFVVALSVLTLCASARLSNGTPTISFEDSKVRCGAYCVASNPSDSVTANLTLYKNGTIVAGWNASGTGSATIDRTYPAVSGATYKLVLSWKVNGVSQTSSTVTKTCP